MAAATSGWNVGGLDVGVDEGGLELRVDAVVGGVAVRVGAGPSVVLDGGVQRLRAVGDVVAKPSGEEDDLRLGGLGVLVGGDEGAIVAEGAFEALVDLGGDVGLQADLLRGQGKVGMRGLRGGEGADVVVAAAGQRAD